MDTAINVSAVCSFVIDLYVKKTLSGRLQKLKNKRKVQLGNPKNGRGRLRDPLWSQRFRRLRGTGRLLGTLGRK